LTLALAAWLAAACTAAATPSPTPSLTPSPLPLSAASRAEETATALATSTPTPTLAFAVPDAELPLSAVAYRIPLTIRHVTQNEASLFFELSEPMAGAVYLLPVGSADRPRMADLSPTEVEQRIGFEGLTPGATYRVVVVLEDSQSGLLQPNFLGRAWGPVRVRTLSGIGLLRFAAIGDASFGDPATRSLIGEIAAADVDFVVHAGDVVDETEQGADPYQSYAAKFYDVFEPVLRSVPVYTVPGNHDYDLDIRYNGEPFYFHAFPPFTDAGTTSQPNSGWNQFYEFEAAGVRFLMLDSQVLFGAPGRDAETAWLKDRLSETGYRATMTVVHVAPFSSSSVHPGDSLAVRAGWVPLFEQAHVSLVISGHFHDYERLAVNGIPYVVTGGGSSTLYAPGAMLAQSQVFARRSHFVLGEIGGDTLTLTAIGLDGQSFDRFTIPLE
jgi:predicted phosphodiesterase